MSDDKYKIDFYRGHNPDTGKGYYRVVVTSLSDGVVVMDAATYYQREKPIYFCDVVNHNIHELGADFPPDPKEAGTPITRDFISTFFDEREDKGHDHP